MTSFPPSLTVYVDLTMLLILDTSDESSSEFERDKKKDG